MADGKKSFILYCDQRGLFDKLSDEQAGRLIKHIFWYVSDENPVSDFVTELAFESIKTQLKRDLKSWEAKQEQRKQAGIKSAEVRKQNSTTVNERSTKSNDRSVSSTVNGNVNVNVNVSSKEDVLIVWLHQNAPRVMKMKEPLTVDEAVKLRKDFSKDLIKDIFLSMDNYEPLLKKNRSAYKTFRNWEKRREPTKSTKNETQEEREAREIMEELKRQSTNEILYGNVQPNDNDNGIASDNRLRRLSN